MKITIRPATIDDIPQMVTLGREFYEMTPYAHCIPYNPVSTRFLFESMLATADCIVLAAVTPDGDLVGGIGGTSGPSTYNFDYRVMMENFWFISQTHRGGTLALRLWQALEAHAVERNNTFLIMGCFTHMEEIKISGLYRKKGYIETETLFFKEL